MTHDLSIERDGSTSAMPVLTEVADFNAVLDYFLAYTGIDHDKIFLFGESQGGFVSAYVAGKRPEDVTRFILLYSAVVLQDDLDSGNGPVQTNMWGRPD